MTPITVRTFTPDLVLSKAASAISLIVSERSKKGKLLLLLSGGSAIQMYRQVFEELSSSQQDFSMLTVSLFDERFVPVDSADSNAKQLDDAGVVDLVHKMNARWLPYLVTGQSGQEVAAQVSRQFSSLIDEGSQLIILAGLGDDGHTAGLLPTHHKLTLNKVFESTQVVEYYQLPDDTVNPYRYRVTATPALLPHADLVILYAVGDKKHSPLQRLVQREGTLSQLPALALLSSQELIVITDQSVEEAT